LTEGVFPIVHNKTKVKDVLEMAGGVSEDANLNMAYIARRGANNSQSFDLRRETLEFIQNSDLSLEDTTRFNIDMQTRLPFVSCDFKQLIINNSEEDNVVLKDGDLVEVDADNATILIINKVGAK
jgi:protein involved in polysaccharide export with SLBB domain